MHVIDITVWKWCESIKPQDVHSELLQQMTKTHVYSIFGNLQCVLHSFFSVTDVSRQGLGFTASSSHFLARCSFHLEALVPSWQVYQFTLVM